MGILNAARPGLLGATLLILVSGSPLGGQNYDLFTQIADLSGPDSPIKASGQASFHQELSAESVKSQWKIAARLVNVSNKTVLAYEASFELFPDYGGGVCRTQQADYFFRLELEFKPGVQQTVDEDSPSVDVTPREKGAKPTRPTASFRVIFVQFADGSKFGTSQWGTALSAVRKQTIERLQIVLEAFRSSGGEGLRLALAKARARPDNPALTNAILDDANDTLETKGPGAAAVQITGFLDAAQRRRSIM